MVDTSSASSVRSRALDQQAFEERDGPREGRELGAGEALQALGQYQHSELPALLQELDAARGRLDQNRAAIVRLGAASNEPRTPQLLDQPAHGGDPDVLCIGERAESARTAENEHRER